MMRISYPAFSSGVDIARMPSGAVASMLEKEATKKTIFFEDLMGAALRGRIVRPDWTLADVSAPNGTDQISFLRVERYAQGKWNLSRSCKVLVKPLICGVLTLCGPASIVRQSPIVAQPQKYQHDLSH